ncbi:PleD family two-component system response regulator [Streptomyces sp. NPDC016845]|uniref:PleD family two-component system response regulator n=1 Tax=Streptomyces sp. NPDC016845 TaxID=3364972 RepID=UPI0037A3179B
MGKTRTRWWVSTYSRVVPGASGRVLVVDDNKVIRQLIRVNLELEGFEVVTAADGAECLDVVHQVQPDVVTLDVVMPRLDGLRTAARLRGDARTSGLPIVVVSACNEVEVETGLEVGVDAFLAKPFEPNELVRVVGELRKRGRGAETPLVPMAPVASSAPSSADTRHDSKSPSGDQPRPSTTDSAHTSDDPGQPAQSPDSSSPAPGA